MQLTYKVHVPYLEHFHQPQINLLQTSDPKNWFEQCITTDFQMLRKNQNQTIYGKLVQFLVTHLLTLFTLYLKFNNKMHLCMHDIRNQYFISSA